MAMNVSGAPSLTTERAFARLARAFVENSCSRSTQASAAALKKGVSPGHRSAAAQITAESSWGLCWGSFVRATSSSDGNRLDHVWICSFANDHRMFAMFCGTISCRFCSDTCSTCANKAGCCRPTVAKAHVVFESSCGLKSLILDSSAATAPNALNSRAFAHRLFAKAQRALEISCGFSSWAWDASSCARLLKRPRWRRRSVAKDHAIVERHCTLNSPSLRRRSRTAASARRSEGHVDSLA
mmetsp:Transcript_1661/g.4561  ORF Transcript_1661/g.4561 Transcript_1661/m.4561 type:complete len:241 (-) Transcript_1661:572-1294(-)